MVRAISGIGPSGAKNEYSQGPLVGNWIEDNVVIGLGGAGACQPFEKHWVGRPETMTQTQQTGPGRTGQDLLHLRNSTQPEARMDLSHGTLLHHGIVESLDKHRLLDMTIQDVSTGVPFEKRTDHMVQQSLYIGKESQDLRIPTGTVHTSRRDAYLARAAAERAGRDFDRFATTSKAAAEHVVAAAGGVFVKQEQKRMTMALTPELLAPAGRKATGEFVNTFDMQHTKTGLRR